MLASSSTQPPMSRQCEYSSSRTPDVRQRACALLLILGAAVPGAVAAQAPAAPDTAALGRLPFRRGQWGAEVELFSGIRAGLLRFSTPTRAWLIDVSAFAHAENSNDPDGTTRTTGSADAEIRIGRRGYRPLLRRTGSSEARVAAFGGFGGSMGGSWTRAFSYRQSRVSLGVFVEPGATAFITDYLALSASVQGILVGDYITATYDPRAGGQQKTISRRVRVSVGGVRLFGSVFF